MPTEFSASSSLIDFYSGRSPDAAGRRIEEIWTWTEDRLEHVHDYIQWLFPLRERSGFNPDAPTLSDADITSFRTSDGLQSRLLRSLRLMLRFYGLKLDHDATGEPAIEPAENFAIRSRIWLTPGNHNHLRLTRIMTSLSLLGLRREALALQRCLIDVARDHPEAVSGESMRYWEGAVGL